MDLEKFGIRTKNDEKKAIRQIEVSNINNSQYSHRHLTINYDSNWYIKRVLDA